LAEIVGAVAWDFEPSLKSQTRAQPAAAASIAARDRGFDPADLQVLRG
jgi:hypothetical protein